MKMLIGSGCLRDSFRNPPPVPQINSTNDILIGQDDLSAAAGCTLAMRGNIWMFSCDVPLDLIMSLFFASPVLFWWKKSSLNNFETSIA